VPGVVSWAPPKVRVMPGLRVLSLGGTGIISAAGSWPAVERGIDLFVPYALSDRLAQACRPGS
jgi:hypothetical protein